MAGNASQDHSFYPTKYQSGWLHLTSIREGCWFDILAGNENDYFCFQPDSLRGLRPVTNYEGQGPDSTDNYKSDKIQKNTKYVLQKYKYL